MLKFSYIHKVITPIGLNTYDLGIYGFSVTTNDHTILWKWKKPHVNRYYIAIKLSMQN